MDMIPSGIWILFNICAVLALISAMLAPGKQSLWREPLRWDGLSALLIPLGVLLVGLFIVWGMPDFPKLALGVIGGAILPWAANRICGSRAFLMIISLVLVALVTMPVTEPSTLAAIITGMLVGQLAEVSHQQHDNPETHTPWAAFLPAMAWLTGLLWIRVTDVPAPLLSVLVTAAAMLLLLSGLEIQWPRIAALQKIPNISRTFVYALLGFAGLYVVIHNVLLAPTLTLWACMFAMGIISAGVIRGLFLQDSYHKPDLAMLLILMAIIGLDTLVPARLIGSLGWIIAALGLLSGIANSSLVMANRYIKLGVLFLISRTLLQVFVYQYNPNVTGINLTHHYASAALFLGMAPMIVYPWVLDVWPKRVRSLMLLCISIVAPAAINYFLHAEASGSFLVSASFGGLVVALFSPYMSEVHPRYANQLMPKAALMTCTALLAGPLIESGNTADKTQQMIALTVGMILLVTIVSLLKSRLRPSPGQAV